MSIEYRLNRRGHRVVRVLLLLTAVATAVGLFLASIGFAAVAQLLMQSEVRP